MGKSTKNLSDVLSSQKIKEIVAQLKALTKRELALVKQRNMLRTRLQNKLLKAKVGKFYAEKRSGKLTSVYEIVKFVGNWLFGTKVSTWTQSLDDGFHASIETDTHIDDNALLDKYEISKFTFDKFVQKVLDDSRIRAFRVKAKKK